MPKTGSHCIRRECKSSVTATRLRWCECDKNLAKIAYFKSICPSIHKSTGSGRCITHLGVYVYRVKGFDRFSSIHVAQKRVRFLSVYLAMFNSSYSQGSQKINTQSVHTRSQNSCLLLLCNYKYEFSVHIGNFHFKPLNHSHGRSTAS